MHWRYRERAVRYIEVHRDDFEPFMEDDEKFEVSQIVPSPYEPT